MNLTKLLVTSGDTGYTPENTGDPLSPLLRLYW